MYEEAMTAVDAEKWKTAAIEEAFRFSRRSNVWTEVYESVGERKTNISWGIRH